MAYDQAKAEAYNRARAQGLNQRDALAAAGITTNERFSYATGPNGQIGPREQIVANLGQTQGSVSAPTDGSTDSQGRPVEVLSGNAAARARAEEAAFQQTGAVPLTPYAQTATPAPGTITRREYTETSTTSISGGGSTTIVATPAKATPASQALDTQAQQTQREIEALQLANSGFGSGPQLTEQQMAANDAKILQLQQQYNTQRDAAESAKTPSPPSINVVPNTTTTASTVTYEKSVEIVPVSYTGDPAQITRSFEPSTLTRDTPVSDTGISLQLPGGALQFSSQEQLTAWQENPQSFAVQNVGGVNTVVPFAAGPVATDVPVSSPTDYGTTYDEFDSVAITRVQSTTADAVNPDQDEAVSPPAVAVGADEVAEVAPQPPPQQSVFPTAFDNEGNLSPGFELDENNNPVRFDPDTPPTVFSPDSGLSDEEILARQNAGGLSDEEILARQQQPVNPGTDPGIGGIAYDDDGNLNPGYTLDENNNPVFVGGGFVEPATAESAAASREAATKLRAQKQATVQARYKQPGNADWRVRLSLGPGAQYLYNATPAGVLAPLAAKGGTDGVIFPYTPSITTAYSANYEQYDLTHSNYRGLFYKSSRVGDIQLRGIFTAQDTTEANYLLAVIHFFRSVTKMFYGQDTDLRGTPPPICLLNGFGGYQFSDHPVVVSSFNYSLPNDVDYIRTTNPNNFGLNLNNRYNPSGVSLPAGGALAGLNRLLNAIPGGLSKGALPRVPAPNTVAGSVTNNVPASYVPTKMEIDVTLIPVQTRSQVSQQFSLKGFANGDLLKGGFW